VHPESKSQTTSSKKLGNSLKNSGFWLQSPAEFRAREEVGIPVLGVGEKGVGFVMVLLFFTKVGQKSMVSWASALVC